MDAEQAIGAFYVGIVLVALFVLAIATEDRW